MIDADGNPVNGKTDWNDVGGGITDDVQLCLPDNVFDDIVEISRIVDFGSNQGMYKYILNEQDTADEGMIVIRSAIATYENREHEFPIVQTTMLHAGTAQAGGAASITLSLSALSDDGRYVPCLCVLRAGTGAGQVRQAIGYVGATKALTVDRAWETPPDGSTKYELYPVASPRAIASDVWDGIALEGSDTGGDILTRIRAGVIGKLTGLDAIRAAGGTGTATYYDAAGNVLFTIAYTTDGRQNGA